MVANKQEELQIENMKRDLKGWSQKLRPYLKANSKKAVWQICTSILPFFAIWFLMYQLYELSLIHI